mgnify:FL=1
MDSILYENYLNILKQELVPALGCTEPIAIAYAAAKAHQVLGEFPDSVNMSLSGNIIKNVKGVTVPNSGGLKGIDVAAILGIVGGNADKALEVRQARGSNLRLQPEGVEEERGITVTYRLHILGIGENVLPCVVEGGGRIDQVDVVFDVSQAFRQHFLP